MALAAIKGEKTLSELAQVFDVHPNQIAQWKSQLLEGAAAVFGSGGLASAPAVDLKALHAKIGELALENDPRVKPEDKLFGRRARQGRHVERVALKARLRRDAMIDRSHELSVTRQAKALNISRGSVYYKPRPISAADLAIMRRIDELHLDRPFAGSRMLRDLLAFEGVAIGRERVATMMKRRGIEARRAEGTRTSEPPSEHFQARARAQGLSLSPARARDRQAQPSLGDGHHPRIKSEDRLCIPMARGFVYLAAVVDWSSRRVLSHRLSITMEADFCIEALEEAMARHGRPEIFNTDQGSQFTSAAFTGVLIDNAIAISMDGKGAWRDNVFIERLWKSVKYEEVVCCERHHPNSRWWRCFAGDEGWPLEVGLQEQASNRHELHWSRVSVVNVDGKGGARLRQVRFKETNESEPLMTCRNVLNGVETGTRTSVPRLKVERYLFTAQPASGMKAA